MNILFVSNMYPSRERPSYGVFVKNIYDEMEKTHSGKIILCVMTHSKSKMLPYLFFYLNFLFLLITNRVDIVYCHFLSRTSILGATAKLFGKKVVFNIHGSDYLLPKIKGGIQHKFNLWAINFSNGIVVPSDAFKKLILSDINTNYQDKIFISPSGGVNIPTDVEYSCQNILPLKCLYVGRVNTTKGIDTIIDALNAVTRDLELTVVGKVEEDLFASLNNKNVSCLVVGEVTQELLKKYYTQSNLFLFPTKYFESLGLSPLEAMSFGLPVIGSNYGPVPEYVRDGYNGFLIEKGNSVELLDCIERFCHLSAVQRQKLSVNAISTALEYSRKKVVKELLRYLESCFENA